MVPETRMPENRQQTPVPSGKPNVMYRKYDPARRMTLLLEMDEGLAQPVDLNEFQGYCASNPDRLFEWIFRRMTEASKLTEQLALKQDQVEERVGALEQLNRDLEEMLQKRIDKAVRAQASARPSSPGIG